MIYFIQSGGTKGSIKIGYTKHKINERLKHLQTASPVKLNVLAVCAGTLNDEKLLHAQFIEYRLNGEWFHPAQIIIDYARSLPSISDLDILLNEKIPFGQQLETSTLEMILYETEHNLLKYAMDKEHNNKHEAAKILGLSLRQIRYKLFKHGIK